MLVIGDQEAVSLLRFFEDLPDPRSEVNRLHALGDVIVISICAVVALADGPTSIAQWATLNEDWLRRRLTLPNGVPSKDTFRRVLTLLNPLLFQQCFSVWLQSLQGERDAEQEAVKKHIAIDGKTLRRSHDRQAKLGPLHVVSACTGRAAAIVDAHPEKFEGHYYESLLPLAEAFQHDFPASAWVLYRSLLLKRTDS